jgi:hypothetical protein
MAAEPFCPTERVRNVRVFRREDWLIYCALTALNLAAVAVFL